MFTDDALCCNAAPISSAIAMNCPSKISSRTGSSAVPTVTRPAAAARSSISVPSASTRAAQPGSTTTVDVASTISAGPATTVPAASARRWRTATGRMAPSIQAVTVCPRSSPSGDQRSASSTTPGSTASIRTMSSTGTASPA